jgi:hypothetical protein
MSRTGKIARLPRSIRDDLNRRLEENHPSRQILDWVNSLPETRQVLDRDFHGRDINEQNLSDWRQGGFRDWLSHQDTLSTLHELAETTEELSSLPGPRISDQLSSLISARYAADFVAAIKNPDELERRLRSMRGLCRDLAELRRGDHEAARIQLEEARLDRDRQKTASEVLEYLCHWIEYPKLRECLTTPDLTAKARHQQLRQILGLDPDPNPAEADPNPVETDSLSSVN